MIRKTSAKGSNPHFVAKRTPSFRKGNSGGHRYGPTHCPATRGASNVRRSY